MKNECAAVSGDYNLEVWNWVDKGESQPEGRGYGENRSKDITGDKHYEGLRHVSSCLLYSGNDLRKTVFTLVQHYRII